MIAAALLAVQLSFVPLTRDEQIENVLSYLHSEWPHLEPQVVKPDIREDVLQRLKSKLPPDLRIDVDAIQLYRILLRLGDSEFTKLFVETARAREGGAFQELLSEGAQPLVIPLIAEDFSKNDGDSITYKSEDDIGYANRPYSVEMCRVALSVVARSAVFPPQTCEWAEESLRHTDINPPVLIREVMQQWWKENEMHFRADDFPAVQAGRSFPTTAKASWEPKSLNSTIATAMSTDLPNSTAQPLASSVVDSSGPSVETLWTCAAAAIVLLVSLMVFWKRKAS